MRRRAALAALGGLVAVPAPALVQGTVPVTTSGSGVGGGASASVARAPTFDGLRDDLELIEELLRTLHPGLWRYLHPQDFVQGLAQLRRGYLEGETLAARFLALSRFLATLRCGHSYANFYNQRPPVAAELFDRPTRLPFQFRWLGGEMVVTGLAMGAVQGGAAGSLGGQRWAVDGLRPGVVIESINGQSAQALRRALMPLVRVDGHNEYKALSLLEIRGRQRLEFFDVMHGLMAGEGRAGEGQTGEGRIANGRHLLDVRDPDGRRRRLEVPALTMGQRHAGVEMAAAAAASSSGTPGGAPASRGSVADPAALHDWSWQLVPLSGASAGSQRQGQGQGSAAALLRMGGWALYNSRWDWRAWLESRLDELATQPEIRGLIVDIRDNEGGLDCGHPILERYIAQEDKAPARRWVRYRQVPAHLNPVLDTWDDRFRDWGDLPAAPEPGFFSLPEADSRIQPRGPRITKPLVVLVNGVNSSATFGFAQRVQRGGLGLLIGEPTGGNQRGINGGAFFFVRLPGSGLEFDLPLIGYFPEGQAPDAGLMPDRRVVLRPEDVARGADPALAAALAAVGERGALRGG